MSHRNPTCWCGLPSLAKRSTCSDAHAAGAHRGRRRNYERKCRCGARALPKRATCSDACAAAAHGIHRSEPIDRPLPLCTCGRPKGRHALRCRCCFEAYRRVGVRLCKCGAEAFSGKRTCGASACRASGVRVIRKSKRNSGGYRGADRLDLLAYATTEQGGKCAICGGVGHALGDGTVGLVLDHCHTTGLPRAALCGRCNAALGLMREDPASIEALRNYAERCRAMILRNTSI